MANETRDLLAALEAANARVAELEQTLTDMDVVAEETNDTMLVTEDENELLRAHLAEAVRLLSFVLCDADPASTALPSVFVAKGRAFLARLEESPTVRKSRTVGEHTKTEEPCAHPGANAFALRRVGCEARGAEAMKAKAEKRHDCYWCGCKRKRSELSQVTLAGPARRRVLECRDQKKCEEVQNVGA
jgi:hypothetical protein